MRIIYFVIISIITSASAFADDSIFTVKNVGVSRNSDTVILDVVETIPNHTCGDGQQFKLDVTDALAEHFLSVALTSLATGIPLQVGYSPTGCQGQWQNATIPTFWILQGS